MTVMYCVYSETDGSLSVDRYALGESVDHECRNLIACVSELWKGPHVWAIGSITEDDMEKMIEVFRSINPKINEELCAWFV